jgi:hypothetical protein
MTDIPVKLPLNGSSPYKKMPTIDGLLSPGSGTNISLRVTHTGVKKGDKHMIMQNEPTQESFEEINERGWVVRGVKPINSRS